MSRLDVRPGFVVLCCLACFLLPGDVFWSALLLGAAHELGHLAALCLCAVPVRRIRLGALGAVIETGTMAPRTEFVCALAGPAVNLLACWALRRGLPGAAILSLAMGAGNLLPLYPLDGGRALRAALIAALPLRAAAAVGGAAEALTLAALAVGALLLCRRFGAGPAVLYALLLANLARERNFMLPSGPIPDIMKKTTARGKT